MSFTPIDLAAWERREYLDFFGTSSIYMTMQIDITVLSREVKRRGLRLYPALVFCAAKVLNAHREFRYAYNERRELGVWDAVHPYYTVPRKDCPELFSMKCTAFSERFTDFYGRFVCDYAQAEACGKLLCDKDMPPNICGMSIVPDLHYSAFCFGGEPKADLTPFTMFGGFARDGERVMLPVTGEFSHAVNDGVHVSRFFREFEAAANTLFSCE